MRITHLQMTRQAIDYMSDSLYKLGEANWRAADGKKFHKPSDDPTAMASSLNIRSAIRTNEAYLDTAFSTSEWMTVTEHALMEVVEVSTLAQNKVLAGVSDTSGAAERQSYAVELTGLIDQLVETANTKLRDKYIFAGFATSTEPYSITTGTPDTLAFAGNNGIIYRNIAPGQTVQVNVEAETEFTALFDALVTARDELLANNQPGIQASVALIANALDGINTLRTENGARSRQVDMSMERIEKTQAEMKLLLSNREDVNMAEAISELKFQEVVHQQSYTYLEALKVDLERPYM